MFPTSMFPVSAFPPSVFPPGLGETIIEALGAVVHFHANLGRLMHRR